MQQPMDTDKDLIRYAVAALGYTLLSINESTDGEWHAMVKDADTLLEFDPLHNSADAFRLATILQMDIHQKRDVVEVWYHDTASRLFEFVREEVAGDRFAATKRAITRAAAEMGKVLS